VGSALALGQLEPDAACEQGHHERVRADALLFGSPLDLGVKVDGHSDEGLSGLSHSADDSRRVLVSALSDNRPREIAVSGGMASETELPMQSKDTGARAPDTAHKGQWSSIPRGCTGRIEDGRLLHDGDTCPIHEVSSKAGGKDQ
jgi:hypothetical protein